MNLPRITALMFSCLTVFGCDAERTSSSSGDHVERMFGGAKNSAMIQRSSHATIYRLKLPTDPSNPGRPNYRLANDLASYQIVKSAEISGAELDLLKSLIFEESIDDPNSAKACIPVFGVRISFSDGTESLDLNFCFDCDLLWVSRDGAVVGGGDFDPVHKKLAELVRPLFPEDAEIQALK